MLLACEKQGYSRYEANTVVQVGLNIKEEIKKGRQGEKPKGIRLKNYYSEKTLITQQELKRLSFLI